jgi:hypothetical protein
VGCADDVADSPGWIGKVSKFPDFFNDVRNVAFGFCADGIDSPFDTGTQNVFAMVLTVLNYPGDVRFSRERLELYGLFNGKPKKSQLLFQVFVEDLLELWNVGVDAWDSDSDTILKVKGMLIWTLYDFPGLCDAIMHKQHGAYRACPFCTIRGVRCNCLNAMVYSPKLADEEATALSHDDVMDDVRRLEVNITLSTCAHFVLYVYCTLEAMCAYTYSCNEQRFDLRIPCTLIENLHLHVCIRARSNAFV